MPKINEKTIFLNPASPEEVSKIILKLKLKKVGVDKISTKVLQTIEADIAEPICYIINVSSDKGVWSEKL